MQMSRHLTCANSCKVTTVNTCGCGRQRVAINLRRLAEHPYLKQVEVAGVRGASRVADAGQLAGEEVKHLLTKRAGQPRSG